MGSAALLITTAQTAQSDVMNYQCFERDTRRPVAASLIDLSTPEVSCERITLTEPTITSPDQAPEDGAEQPFTDPEISSGPSPYAELSPDPEVVNRYVRNDPFAARRAMNLARGAATRRNGGLRIYRPGICMYESASNNPCLVHAGPEGFEFKIPGGAPGWEQSAGSPSVMTRILVGSDGRSLLQIDQTLITAPETSD
ncbi:MULTISPECIES: hypothetical protein [unclassified Synechococcus]|uniref:hypothetical protein n=1 Tax=unclassified Synechococcus TaxID=2626047 RepID=UPI0012E96958|nr:MULTISPECIES: hypothetical protein [unclassified Synechococcus]